jgi:hypothetical protein
MPERLPTRILLYFAVQIGFTSCRYPYLIIEDLAETEQSMAHMQGKDYSASSIGSESTVAEAGRGRRFDYETLR